MKSTVFRGNRKKVAAPRQPALGVAVVVSLLLLGSCARERIVFQARSEFQEIVVGEERGEIRTLRFGKGGAAQSKVQLGRPEVLLLPYVRASMAGLAFVDEPARILVVGLGGGSIPTFLHRMLPTAEIDVAELDPMVVDVARQWFGVVEDRRLRIVVADGRRFIEEVVEPYDVIFLDAFGRDSVPPALTTEEFLDAVRCAVKPDGVVIANVWGRGSNRLFDSMATTYQEVFEELFVFPVPRRGNRIFVALPRSLGGTPPDLEAKLDQLSRQLGGRLDLGGLLGKGDPRATEQEFEGEILLDREARIASVR